MATLLASRVCEIAQQEVGYVEKATISSLDSKTDNAGRNNYQKYSRDLGVSNGVEWCLIFVNWCFCQAYGLEAATVLLCGLVKNMSTMSTKDKFNASGRLIDVNEARAGDIVWYKRPKGGHAALVVGRGSDGSIIAIGGNGTVNDAPANGGGVTFKSYSVSTWDWCGRPAYDGQGSFKISSGYLGGTVSDSSVTTSASSLVTSSTSFLSNAITSIAENFKSDASIIGSGIVDILGSLSSLSWTVLNYVIKYQTVETEIERDILKTVDSDEVLMGGRNTLLSYPTLVEAPFVQVKIGGYTFGKYTGQGGSLAGLNVDFPNYVNGIQVEKYSGQLNQYTIYISYLILAGDDPNRLDRIFSSVQYGKIYISYGDYNAPTFIYKEEEAQITGVQTSVSFDNSLISYTITATSTALLAASTTQNFKAPDGKVKPSTLIKQILNDSSYGLLEVFPGMKNSLKVTEKIIPTDDQAVELETKNGMDPLNYIQYLVSCMVASSEGYVTGEDGVVIKNYVYRMVICDDNFDSNNMGGCYFKIVKVATDSSSVPSANTYSVDVGYTNYQGVTKDANTGAYVRTTSQEDNKVISFLINSDDAWNLLYKYSDSVDQPKYRYSINSQGAITAEYSPNLLTSNSAYKMTEAQKTWWTNMTRYPISATLVVKGLIRPAVLMSYVKINAIFYGQKHVSSGLYVITGLTDTIGNSSGYKTELQLQKCGGDNDYIEKTKVKVQSTIPVGIEIVSGETKTLADLSFFGSIVSMTKNLVSNAESIADEVTGGLYSNVKALFTDGLETTTTSTSTLTQETYSAQGGYATGGDTRLGRIAAAMCTEQGFGTDEHSLIALGWETSLLLNQFELYKSTFPSDATLEDYIFSGSWNEIPRQEGIQKGYVKYNLSSKASFFQCSAPNAYLNYPGLNLSFSFYTTKARTNKRSGTVTQAHIDMVKKVLNGVRYTTANEQGCDYAKLECNGVIIGGTETGDHGKAAVVASKKSRTDLWIPNVTKLTPYLNGGWGRTSIFLGFPANDPTFDGFAKK